MKTYVKVIAIFHPDGTIIPRAVILENGVTLELTQICDIRRAAAFSAGGYGTRYTCRTCGELLELYLEENRWFIYGMSVGTE